MTSVQFDVRVEMLEQRYDEIHRIARPEGHTEVWYGDNTGCEGVVQYDETGKAEAYQYTRQTQRTFRP